MRKFVSRVVAACALLGTSVSATAGPVMDDIVKTGELRVCFDAGYMPFEMKSKNGSFVGFDIDIGKMMARQMGVKYVPVNTAWDGIIPTLLTGKCHIINAGMTINAQRNMRVNFAEPYIIVGQTILLNPELEGKIKSYKDLNDSKYTIATKLGTTGEQAIKRMISKAKLNVFETQSDAVLEVANGKADAFIYDMPFNAIYASQNTGKVVHLEQPFTYEPLGWAVAQGDMDMLNFLNNFLRQIKGDGTYERIYDKWFKDNSWLSQVQ
ncbi:transporter substrate-binding domain-containing protein [Photobacterium halotolerans]|uniref:Transporter substrate-binding domain-containing protein n=1 Tax=Photobacterium halotolerans TaxID=265726 RepID=A0A7X5ATS4_9GAMM|nr:transporter substrate-binding domain-containing protein [Photobacterium halotolerans]NAW65195.1 transporter substrate-binding domain-containing protein [Photobacterium halotolerans]NAW85417.1 transporter substrate-binding domain-containing protein [Photobacterium halotolerans]NAX48482.1 transporter substrate-binding domain-containing protein [Photobacterium halotolerans]